MKKYLVIVVLLILSVLGTNLLAQTVTVCTFVNGTAPVGKSAKMCRQDSVKLSMTNCASGTHPSVSYRWKNLSVAPYTDTLKSSAIAKDTGVWVGYIKDISAGIEYSDTVHLTYYPSTAGSGTITGVTPSGGAYCVLDTAKVSVIITGTFASYQWYNQDQLTNVLTPISGATGSTLLFTDKPKTIQVVGKDNYGCDVDTFGPNSYTQLQYIDASVGSDVTACQGTSIVVQNRTADTIKLPGYSNISYIYYLNGTAIPGCAFGPQTGGNYSPCTVALPTGGKQKISVKVQALFVNCPNTDTLVANVVAKPVVTLGPDSTICYHQSMAIKSIVSGAGGYTYNWDSSAVPIVSYSNVSSGTPNITVQPNATGYYRLKVTDAANCGIGKDSILVTENPQIFSTISNDTTICMDPASTIQLKATASGGSGSFTYLWAGAPGLSATNILNPTATPVFAPSLRYYTGSSVYQFTATDSKHCSSPTKTVTVKSYVPSLNITANGTVITQNGVNISDPPIVNEVTPVTLTVTSPVSDYSLTWKNWIDTIDSDTIYNYGTAPASYIASLGTSTSSTVNVEYNGPAAIFYSILSHNTNSPSDPLAPNSCLYKDTIKIKYISDDILLYVPNIFSPNAVDPTNQHLRIYVPNNNLSPDGFKFIVYNKWGNLMYETTNPMEAQSDGWDGGAQIEGVYTYVILGKFKSGKDIKESPHNKGTFSLVK